MTTPPQWEDLLGLTAFDVNGDQVGAVSQVYLDEGSGKPAWVTVRTGLRGTRESFAPLHRSSARGGRLLLAVSRQLLKDAPNVEKDGHLSDAEVAALYEYYAAYLGGTLAGEGIRHRGQPGRRLVRPGE